MTASPRAMRRVLVVGCCGAGKSTFARRLADATGLPLIALDPLYWKPGWAETPKDEWTATVERVIAGERWIIDGNYSGTLARRVEACDTLVFLDVPRRICLDRAVQRARNPGTRPDPIPGCPERLTRDFLRWIWRYERTQRPKMLDLVAGMGAGRRGVALRTDDEIERFLADAAVAAAPTS